MAAEAKAAAEAAVEAEWDADFNADFEAVMNLVDLELPAWARGRRGSGSYLYWTKKLRRSGCGMSRRTAATII